MTTTTPNMNLVLPDVSVTAGPQWATLLNAAYALIDSHDHTTGNGVTITPAGLNISSDLTFAQNNATNLRTVRLYPNNSFTPTGTDRTCLYALGGELYYIDAAGNTVQLTLNGSVDVSGSITALSLKDSSFFVQYFGDTSRQFRFNASAIPASTTRILSVPDSGANDTFVTQAASQVLTNKTLTTPIIAAINTGSVTFTLPTVDGTGGQVLQTNGSGLLSFATAATTTGNVAANDSNVTFTNANNRVQYCTPTAPRTYTLPTTGIPAGDTWEFYNSATADANFITIQSSGGNFITVIPPKGKIALFAATATPTTAANWVLTERDSQWVAYTPTFTGFGTVSQLSAYYRVQGDSIKIKATLASGTPTATTASISLPTAFTIATAKTPAGTAISSASGLPLLGQYGSNANNGCGNMLAAGGTSTAVVYFSGNFAGSLATTGSAGTGVVGAGAAITLTVEVAIV